MRNIKIIFPMMLASLICIPSAMAQGSLLTEPSNVSLIALGLLGIFLGHKGSRKIRDE